MREINMFREVWNEWFSRTTEFLQFIIKNCNIIIKMIKYIYPLLIYFKYWE